jgi:XRE family transcriptional regulator, aerobic/anaerobic benzoate catabolism transcriptional regulator
VDFATFLKRLGRNLRRARWRAGMTQQDLAARGITYRYLAELERGVRNPSAQVLFELAGMLGVRVADLVEVGERGAPVDLSKVPDSLAPKPGRKPSAKKKTRRSRAG